MTRPLEDVLRDPAPGDVLKIHFMPSSLGSESVECMAVCGNAIATRSSVNPLIVWNDRKEWGKPYPVISHYEVVEALHG